MKVQELFCDILVIFGNAGVSYTSFVLQYLGFVQF